MTRILQRVTDLHVRIWTEFNAMPGLRLTRDQACRLFGGESSEVLDAFEELIDAGVLRQIGPYYIRADYGSFTA
jgi:hypothetical protein